jgi:hypothetical protein
VGFVSCAEVCHSRLTAGILLGVVLQGFLSVANSLSLYWRRKNWEDEMINISETDTQLAYSIYSIKQVLDFNNVDEECANSLSKGVDLPFEVHCLLKGS